MKRFVAFSMMMLSLPVLQGAGCRAHYWARIHGTLRAAPAEEGRQRIVVIYRKHEPGVRVCTKDWAPCLASGWHPLRVCNSSERKDLPTATTATSHVHEFEGCTDMVGVDYRADIAAFVDANANGRLDSGERYGVYEGSPLTRDMEASALPLEIDIAQVMP